MTKGWGRRVALVAVLMITMSGAAGLRESQRDNLDTSLEAFDTVLDSIYGKIDQGAYESNEKRFRTSKVLKPPAKVQSPPLSRKSSPKNDEDDGEEKPSSAEAAVENNANEQNEKSAIPDSLPLDTVIGSNSKKDEEQVISLREVIPANYERDLLPKPAKGPVIVKLRILLEHIYGVKQLDRTITVGIRTFCLWNDPRLKYDKKILGKDMTYFQVNPDNIWTPRIEILNVVGSDITFRTAQVYGDGTVFLTTRMMSVVTVRFAAEWFPFDRQNFIFEFGELTYSKEMVWLNTTTSDWSPAFDVGHNDESLKKLEVKVEEAQNKLTSTSDTQNAIKSDTIEEKYKEPVEVLQHGNFILGVNVIEDKHGDAYWVVDNFTGWQGLRFGEGARYYYVGVSTLMEMHRGRMHFILVYILPLVFIVTVSQGNFFFDVRDLEPRLTIASGLLLCMVAFQYTIEQEIPKVSYPLWINYYLVGCYSMIVLQCIMMVIIIKIAGRRVASNGRWARHTADNWVAVGPPGPKSTDLSIPACVHDQWAREENAETFNMICSIVYPSLFLVFNIVMFGLVWTYT